MKPVLWAADKLCLHLSWRRQFHRRRSEHFPAPTTMAEVGRKLLTGRAEITPPSLADSLRRSVREAVTTQDWREDA